jgi:hypothetical protein
MITKRDLKGVPEELPCQKIRDVILDCLFT